MTRPRKRRSDSTASLEEKRAVSARERSRKRGRNEPLETLRLDPGKAGHAFSGESDNTVSVTSVLCEDLLIVIRNWERGKVR
jgi:hypothetical protein